MIKQNPLSFIGSTKRIAPLATGYHGWTKAVRVTLVSILLVLAWIGVLLWYCTLTLVLPVVSWVFWGIWTLNRRHHIYRQEQLDAIRDKG